MDVKVVVVYYSRFGTIRALAEAIAEGAQSVPAVQVGLLKVEDEPIEQLRPGETQEHMTHRRALVLNELSSANALIVGAPSYFGSMASPVKRLFEDSTTVGLPVQDRSRPWRHTRFRNRIGAAFASSATPHGGNEQTLHSILTMMMHLGMIVVTPGQGEPILDNQAAPYGATAIAGPTGDREPSQIEREAAVAMGKQVAEVATWITTGWLEWASRRELDTRAKLARGIPGDHQ